MAVDAPARIAIVGAGPIGLEAALYARFLGYEAVVYERGRIGEHLRRRSHVRMLSPFGECRSPLALRALAAQDESFVPPRDDGCLTYGEYCATFLEPLAATDLLADGLRLAQEVLALGRESFLKHELPGQEERGEFDFRLLVRDAGGREVIEHADVLIDASGVLGQPNWLGCSGLPAPGERACRAAIEYGLPDILGHERERYAGRHTLLIGAGASAATNALALARLAQDSPATRVTWISRREPVGAQRGPLAPSATDPLPARRELLEAANALCDLPHSPLIYYPTTDVEAVVCHEAGAFHVELSGRLEGTHLFDNIIASVGHRPDHALYRELQVNLCPATDAPLGLEQPEPNFYILGAKSHGRAPTFTIAAGLRQIVAAMALIGDRAALDLYR